MEKTNDLARFLEMCIKFSGTGEGSIDEYLSEAVCLMRVQECSVIQKVIPRWSVPADVR